MNRTTEGSIQKRAMLVGGETIPLENGEIEMPPENAKKAEEIIKNIEQGNFMTITVENCNAKDVLSKEDIAKLEQNRKARRTRSALRREKEEVK